MFSDNYQILFRLHNGDLKYVDSVKAPPQKKKNAVHTMVHNSQSITLWSRLMDTRNSSDQLIHMKCRVQNFLRCSLNTTTAVHSTVPCWHLLNRAKHSTELAVCIKTVVVELWCHVGQSVRTFREYFLLLSWGLTGSFVQIIVKLGYFK